jgi:hypothetical protein
MPIVAKVVDKATSESAVSPELVRTGMVGIG